MFFCLIAKAQELPCPSCESTGGVGGNGYGSAASPIDMYVYVLALIAVLMIAFIAKKYKTQKI